MFPKSISQPRGAQCSLGKPINAIRIIVFAVLGIGLGFFGLSLLFSDLGPGETQASRNATVAIFTFLSGLFMGYFNPKVWFLAGLVAWGGALLGIGGLTSNPVSALGVMLLSLGPALLGGYIGGLIGRKYSIGILSIDFVAAVSLGNQPR